MKRRQFLNTMLLGTSIPVLGPARFAMAQSGCSDICVNSVDTCSTSVKSRLVLIELAGANDGLNTLVPYTNDEYQRRRPGIGLSARQVAALNADLGMHEALKPLLPVWEQGQLAWVQGLGYPQASRNHFDSAAMWETASDSIQSPSSEGWLTHAIEHQTARTINDLHGINLSGSRSLFASDSGRWLSACSVSDLLIEAATDHTPAQGRPAEAIIADQRHRLPDSTLNSLSIKLQGCESRAALPDYGGGAFGEQLRQTAIMIAAGLDTPVYRIRLNGFDTHHNQPARHHRALHTLASGLASFIASLRDMNEWNNTLVMSYSEFGRRLAENASSGTDHGTAAPHFLLGGSVAGGLYGEAPDLNNLAGDDLMHTMDFRALYHSILVDGLGVDKGTSKLNKFVDSRLQGLLNHA